MTIFDSIILGLIEGITEFLPISSTAHLMMTSRILGLHTLGFEQTEFLKSFEIIIQLGALCAVFFLFGKRIIHNSHLWKRIAIAFLPTAIIGLTLYSWIKTHLIGNLDIAVWTLALGGFAFIGIEYYLDKRTKRVAQETEQKNPESREVRIHSPEEISNKQAWIIGLCQSLAIIPGISRAAATIIPALLFGTSRIAAAEFSFMLALPTVAAAAGLDLLKNFDIISNPANIPLLLIGFLVSFGAAIGGIKFFLTYIGRHSFTAFGIYRIIIAAVFYIFFIR